jgi:AcrR family transcriptional regulator
VERLVAAAEAAVEGGSSWVDRLSAGLRVGLEFLAAEPQLAHLLLVESLAAARPARLEYERSLERLAEALRSPPSKLADGERVSEETARLLAGGLASHVSGRLLADEAERLPELHDVLLRYLLAPSLAALRTTDEQRASAL